MLIVLWLYNPPPPFLYSTPFRASPLQVIKDYKLRLIVLSQYTPPPFFTLSPFRASPLQVIKDSN